MFVCSGFPLGRYYLRDGHRTHHGPGWDNVTGVGTPNGLAFVNGVLAQLP